MTLSRHVSLSVVPLVMLCSSLPATAGDTPYTFNRSINDPYNHSSRYQVPPVGGWEAVMQQEIREQKAAAYQKQLEEQRQAEQASAKQDSNGSKQNYSYPSGSGSKADNSTRGSVQANDPQGLTPGYKPTYRKRSGRSSPFGGMPWGGSGPSPFGKGSPWSGSGFSPFGKGGPWGGKSKSKNRYKGNNKENNTSNSKYKSSPGSNNPWNGWR